MDKMEWALWSLTYLRKARIAMHEDFNGAMNEVRDNAAARQESWYSCCKDVVPTLYHYSMEFAEDVEIPSERFASPDVFEEELDAYSIWLGDMADRLCGEDASYRAKNKLDGPPFLVTVAQRQVTNVTAAVEYVRSKRPVAPVASPVVADVDLIVGLAKRFGEAVLSMNEHPHGGRIYEVANEWDCQYLFRAILASYIPDIRDEEWNPSVAGSSSRCEFFLKTLNTMIELKYVRKPTDAKKIKIELASDFLDYSKNPQVDNVICLIYDPISKLKTPAAILSDLSGPVNGLARIEVVISPPRS